MMRLDQIVSPNATDVVYVASLRESMSETIQNCLKLSLKLFMIAYARVNQAMVQHAQSKRGTIIVCNLYHSTFVRL